SRGPRPGRCGRRSLRRARAADRADWPGGHGRRLLHPRRPDLQRPGHCADLRHPGLDRADAGGDPAAVLRAAERTCPQTGEGCMKGMKHYSPVLALALLAGCGGEAAPEAEATAPPEPEVVAQAAPVPADEPAPDAQARGQAAMREFGDRLRNELRAAMSEDGPAGAVSFCHDQAPRIADEVMATHGVRLGRVAVAGRNRNPGNAHGGWQ